jgi:hypothetical protein
VSVPFWASQVDRVHQTPSPRLLSSWSTSASPTPRRAARKALLAPTSSAGYMFAAHLVIPYPINHDLYTRQRVFLVLRLEQLDHKTHDC